MSEAREVFGRCDCCHVETLAPGVTRYVSSVSSVDVAALQHHMCFPCVDKYADVVRHVRAEESS